MTMPSWVKQGTLGTKSWQDEGNFLQFLAGVYGSWVLAMGYRGIYSFQLQNSPLYQWWLKEGKPTNATRYKETATAAKPVKEFWELSETEWSEKLQDKNFQPQQAPEGYQWSWQSGFSPTGQPTKSMWSLQPVTPEAEPVDPMIQRLMGLDVEKFEWQKQQTEKDWMAQQQQAGNEYLKSMADREAAQIWQNTMNFQNVMLGRPESDAQANKERQAALAEEFESVRQQAIQSFQPSARDWLSLYKAQTAPNKFIPQEVTNADRYNSMVEEVEHWDKAYKYATDLEKAAAKDPNKALSFNEKGMIEETKKQWSNARRTLLETQLARSRGATAAITGARPDFSNEQEAEGYYAAPRQTPMGGYEVGAPEVAQTETPTMPVIPTWLQQVSGLTGRVPESRTEIVRPSAQQWQRLMPEQQEMYAGLVDWAGKDTYLSKLTQMQQQIPQSLSLGRKWTPARQV